MTANYHTHTWRCNHADGTEREYVEAALQAGLKILGFSDHSPYCFPGGYRSGFRMELDQAEEYAQRILDLRREYRGRIQIPLGLEMEYYPSYLPELKARLRDLPLDYLLLGQHFVGQEPDGVPTGGAITRQLLVKYCDQVVDAVQSGLYTYIAHPDMIRFQEDDAFYRRQVGRICREARDCGLPLEINLLGLREGRNYPNPLFWQVAAEENCPVVLGRDAHRSDALLDTDTLEKAMTLVRTLGLNLLPQVTLRKPF